MYKHDHDDDQEDQQDCTASKSKKIMRSYISHEFVFHGQQRSVQRTYTYISSFSHTHPPSLFYDYFLKHSDIIYILYYVAKYVMQLHDSLTHAR